MKYFKYLLILFTIVLFSSCTEIETTYTSRTYNIYSKEINTISKENPNLYKIVQFDNDLYILDENNNYIKKYSTNITGLCICTIIFVFIIGIVIGVTTSDI